MIKDTLFKLMVTMAKQNKMLVSGFIAKFYMGRSVGKTFYFFKNISSLEICSKLEVWCKQVKTHYKLLDFSLL